MKKKRVVIVTSYPIHSEPVIRNRLSSYISVMSNDGWKVCLVTPESDHEGRIEKTVPTGLSKVYYIEPKKYNKQKFVERGINEIKIALKLIKTSYKIEADLRIFSCPFNIPIAFCI